MFDKKELQVLLELSKRAKIEGSEATTVAILQQKIVGLIRNTESTGTPKAPEAPTETETTSEQATENIS